jgi:hypothetical protein
MSVPQYDPISRHLLPRLLHILYRHIGGTFGADGRPEPDHRVVDALSWRLGAHAASSVTDEARIGLRWHHVGKTRETSAVTCPGGAQVDEFDSWPLWRDEQQRKLIDGWGR